MMVDLAPDAIDDAFWRHHQRERAGCRNRQFRAPASQSQIRYDPMRYTWIRPRSGLLSGAPVGRGIGIITTGWIRLWKLDSSDLELWVTT